MLNCLRALSTCAVLGFFGFYAMEIAPKPYFPCPSLDEPRCLRAGHIGKFLQHVQRVPCLAGMESTSWIYPPLVQPKVFGAFSYTCLASEEEGFKECVSSCRISWGPFFSPLRGFFGRNISGFIYWNASMRSYPVYMNRVIES